MITSALTHISSYEQLTPVLFGNGSLKKLGDKITEMSCKKVLCVFDSGVKACGIAGRLESILENAGIDYVVFDKVLPDPDDTIVLECARFAREQGVDCVTAVGGGSCMDTAKAAVLMIDHEEPLSRWFFDLSTENEGSVPLILVPTTSGTGSECTRVAVITDTASGKKMGVFLRASLAILDPELTLTVPATVTAYTGFDAFCHAAEAVTSRIWNHHSELLGLEAIRLIFRYLPAAIENGSDLEARYHLSLASNFAGIAFADASCHMAHAMGDAMSIDFHTPHGFNCSVCIAETLQACAKEAPDKVLLVGCAMGIDYNGNETPEEIGLKTAEGIRRFMKICKIPSLKEYGISREDFIRCAATCVELDMPFMYHYPGEITEESITALFSGSWDNYQ